MISAARVSVMWPRTLGSKRVTLRASVAVTATRPSSALTARSKFTAPMSEKVFTTVLVAVAISATSVSSWS